MLKNVEEKMKEFQNLEEIKKELKRLQSLKCNLKKNKFQKDYEAKMTAILQEEQLMKEVRDLFNPKKKFVTELTQEDVDRLDWDETIKAIKSIQSKKYHTRWLTPVEGDNDEYRSACQIEEMLLNHKNEVRPIEETVVRKSDIQTIIETIENSGNLSQEEILRLLKGLQ